MSSPGALVRPRPARRLVWSGRFSSEFPGLDGWTCKWPMLSRNLRGVSELVILDALSFPWERLTVEHWQVPFLAWLPADLDAHAQSALFGGLLFRHLSPFDRLVHHDSELQAAISRQWLLPANSWLTPAGASRQDYVQALQEQSRSKLISASGDIGTFRMEPGDLITRHVLEHGAHQRGTLNLALALLAPGQTVIDAGAHVGTFSVPLCREVQPGGRLIAIEGDPVNASLLRENLSLNGLDGVSAVVEAVLGKAGESVIALGEAGNTGATRFSAADRREVGAVQATTLDDIVEEIGGIDDLAMVKLDLEGAELDALLGANDLIDRTSPILICEVSPRLLAEKTTTVEELTRWFDGANYLLYAITGPRNFRGDDWEATKIDRLEEWPEAHFDIVAVPKGSPRLQLLEPGSSDG